LTRLKKKEKKKAYFFFLHPNSDCSVTLEGCQKNKNEDLLVNLSSADLSNRRARLPEQVLGCRGEGGSHDGDDGGGVRETSCSSS